MDKANEIVEVANKLALQIEAYTLPTSKARMLSFAVAGFDVSFFRDQESTNYVIECIRQIYLLSDYADSDNK
jgi:hypothetical protein